MFQPSLVTPACNRLATRLAFQINEILVARRADSISQGHESKEKYVSSKLEMSDAGTAKIRYVAGACLSTIIIRLRSDRHNKHGQFSQKEICVQAAQDS